MAREVGGIVTGAKQDFLIREGNAVLACDHDLVGVATGVDVVALVLHVAGVVEAQEVAAIGRTASYHQGGARIHAVGVLGNGGRKGLPQILPVHQVTTGKVAPALLAGGWPVGGCLVEDMIGAVELTQTVGVVEPPLAWCQVEVGCPALVRGGHGSPLLGARIERETGDRQKRPPAWVC